MFEFYGVIYTVEKARKMELIMYDVLSYAAFTARTNVPRIFYNG